MTDIQNTHIQELRNAFNDFGNQEFYKHYVDCALSIARLAHHALQALKNLDESEYNQFLNETLTGDFIGQEKLDFPSDEKRIEMTYKLRDFILFYHHVLDQYVVEMNNPEWRTELVNSVVNIVIACQECSLLYHFPLNKMLELVENENEDVFTRTTSVLLDHGMDSRLIKPKFDLKNY